MFMTMMMTNSGNDGVLVMTECKVTDKLISGEGKLQIGKKFSEGQWQKVHEKLIF